MADATNPRVYFNMVFEKNNGEKVELGKIDMTLRADVVNLVKHLYFFALCFWVRKKKCTFFPKTKKVKCFDSNERFKCFFNMKKESKNSKCNSCKVQKFQSAI